MNKHQSLLWKMDALLAFIDLKLALLVWVMIDLYRNTELLGVMTKKNTLPVAQVLGYVWDNCGSPYLIWIPIMAVADVAIKRMIKSTLE